jgi:hypothetical protein
MNNDDSKDKKVDSTATAATAEVKTEKLKFGSLAPLTAAQIVTLLVGTTGSNSSYGGY